MQSTMETGSTRQELDYWKKAATIIRKEIKALDLDPFKLLSCDPKKFVSLAQNDVVIASYPRSGGNLVSEILYNIVMKIQEKCSMEITDCVIRVYEATSAQDLLEEEEDEEGQEEEKDENDENQGKNKRKSGSIYTSKLRYGYMTRYANKSKIIYVVRNPKHAALELYNTFYIKHMSFRDFVDIFLGFQDPENPYNYKTHFLEYLENKQKLDILFLKYEELDQNPGAVVESILEHLGLDMISFTPKEMKEMVTVKEQSQLTTWNALARSIKTNEFISFFDSELLAKFERELKVNWKLVHSGTV